MSLSAESVAFWGWDAGTAESAEFWGWYGENTYVAPATFISLLNLSSDIRVTTSDRALVGDVDAYVKGTEVFDGPNRLDTVRIPKWFLKQTGARVSKPQLSTNGWCIKYDGDWYTLERVVTDNEKTVTFSGSSIEKSELSRAYSSTSCNPFVRRAQIPTDIMTELLAGTGGLELQNADLADTEYIAVGTTFDRLIGWARLDFGNGNVGTNEALPEMYPRAGVYTSSTTYPVRVNLIAQTDDSANGAPHVFALPVLNALSTAHVVQWVMPYAAACK